MSDKTDIESKFKTASSPGSAASAAGPKPTRPTGQKRSLERGKSTRKKNPGKRATQGG